MGKEENLQDTQQIAGSEAEQQEGTFLYTLEETAEDAQGLQQPWTEDGCLGRARGAGQRWEVGEDQRGHDQGVTHPTPPRVTQGQPHLQQPHLEPSLSPSFPSSAQQWRREGPRRSITKKVHFYQ